MISSDIQVEREQVLQECIVMVGNGFRLMTMFAHEDTSRQIVNIL